ncbi:MAG: hypothetical protein HOP12_11550 [Candidatus Eisenbacteria bacterium]|uniref:Porin n=1 Tax=Eiseniibacteriota bacterium TaxID=2212470 RepID=A0A849STS4_UNCEI|nr:hypothetical protein [Candidatus Eisenbacteria bacterium]
MPDVPRSPAARFLILAVLALVTPCAVRAQSTPESPATEASATEALGRIEGMSEQLQTLQSDVDKLKRFKFSGYVQARYEIGETSSDTVKSAGSPATLTLANRDRFYLRRARLKLTYDPTSRSHAVLYLNGASTGNTLNITLLEAYVSLLDPWTTDHRHQLWVGQMNVPFGWEVERSSSARELPERSRAENVLFPGERDRGVKLVNPWTPHFETTLGVFNGGGTLDATFGTEDPTRAKDLVGRARFSQGRFDVAVSGYRGSTLVPLTGGDVALDKTRFGADAQAYWELPSAGGGSLRAEWYAGTQPNADSLKTLVVAPTSGNPVTLLRAGADPSHLATEFHGGYVMWAQNLGDQAQLAARYEFFDPDDAVEHDQFERLSVGANFFYDGTTRLTLAYDIPRTDLRNASGGYDDPSDNLWTFQVQLRY